MNQTVTVNISGIVFHIEVDAYDKLKNYLNKIRSYFKNSEECEEIMTDIEARIAELFNARLTSTNQVIRSKDVEEVIGIMGKPEQYIDEEGESQEERTSTHQNYNTAKKLFRDPDDRMIGGVAAGIAAYFGMEALWLRLFFVVAIFLGFGFLLYLILWIVIPEAKTASDKLQMKGDAVNIDNIGKTFRNEADKVSENLKKNGQHYGKKAETAIEGVVRFIGQIFKGIFKVFGKLFGVLFLIFGTFLLVTLMGLVLGSETIFSITSDGIFSIESNEFFNLIFISDNQFHFAIIGAVLTLGIPVVMLIYAGVKLLFNVKTYNGVAIGMFVLWVIGIFMCGMIAIRMGTELSHDDSTEDVMVLESGVDDYLISAATDISPGRGILEDRYSYISLDDDSIYINDIRLNVFKNNTDSLEIRIIKSSNGHSSKDATNNAKKIDYNYSFKGNKLFLSNYLSTLKEHKIRGQQIELELYLPVGKSVYLDKSLKQIIHDIDNVTNTWDKRMLDKNWVMLEDGLTCLDCDRIEGVTSSQLDSIRTNLSVREKR